ncbi:hypothetical protein V1525DRAFT_411949 [Lipomyces kononenkoae]|uniref:Uncharacterized protein n=1 Tax=Lipomyces kononenkoae TaxID=34357 RepID=A0ACC3STS8_LIPKO
MVFKSFAAIARHSALAKNLFVASTATSAQPAFFVSTQQLARQQATAQAQQLVTRGFHQSFTSGGPGASGNHPSANGAAFPSYGPSFNANSLSVSTTSSSNDDERRLNQELNVPRKRLPTTSSAHAPIKVVETNGVYHPVRFLSTSARSSAKQITQSGEIGSSQNEIEELRVDPGRIPDEERLIEVDDETAATMIAAAEQVKLQQQQVQIYHNYKHFTPSPSSQSKRQKILDLSTPSPHTEVSPVQPKAEHLKEPEPITPPEFAETTTQQLPPEVNPYVPLWQNAALFTTPDTALSATESARVIDSLFTAKHFTGVLSHYELMRESRTVPTLASFNQILISIASSDQVTPSTGRESYLLEVYADMLQHHIVPDVATYSTVILTLVQRFMNTRQILTENFKSVKLRNELTVPEFDLMMETLSNEPSLDLALDIFFASVTVRMQDYPIDVYNALFEACAEAGKVNRAIQVLSVLEPPEAETPHVPYNADTYIHLMRLFASVKDITSAVEVFTYYKEAANSLENAKLVRVYAELIRAYFKCGETDNAIDFFEKVTQDTNEDNIAGPLCDALMEGFLVSHDYEAAWEWVLHSVSENNFPRPSQAALASLLSVASRENDLEKAGRVYEYMLDGYGMKTESANALCDYLNACLAFKTASGLNRVLSILDSVIANKIQLEMHTIRDAAIYLLEHPLSTEDNLHQAFVLVSTAHVGVKWRSREEMHLYSIMWEQALMRMMSLVKWSSLTDSTAIFSRILRIIMWLDPSYLMPKGPGEELASLVGMVLTQYWNDAARGLYPSREDVSRVIYLHARLVVESNDGSGEFTPFVQKTISSLSHLLSFAGENNILLTPSTNYFVTLAAPILNLSVPVPVTDAYMPEMMLAADQEYPMSQPAQTAITYDSEIPMRYRNPARNRDYHDEQRMVDQMIGASEIVTKEVLRRIIVDAPLQQIMDYTKTQYQQGHGVSPTAVVKLITYAATQRSVRSAEEVFGLAQTTIPPFTELPSLYFVWSSIYNAMLNMYLQAEGKEALSYKDKVVEFKQKLMDMGTAPNAASYANLILKLKLAGSHDEAAEAIALFKESQAFKVAPTTFLYNALLSKLSKARRLKEALFYFDQMAEIGLRRSSVTYGTMISACCRAGDESTAERLFKEMEDAQDYKPRIAPFNTMLQFYVTHKRDRVRALHYFNRMSQLNIIPSSHTYKLLIDAFATIEPIDMDAAKQVLNMIKHDRQPVTTQHYAALIAAEGCVQQNIDGAQTLFDDVVRNLHVVPDETMFQALIESYIGNDAVERTDKIIENMRDQYDVGITAYMANTLIRGWATTDINRSRDFFDHVYHRKKAEPSTFEAMIRGYIAMNQTDSAKEVLSLMKSQGYPEAVVARVRVLFTEQDDNIRKDEVGVSAEANSSPDSIEPPKELDDLFVIDPVANSVVDVPRISVNTTLSGSSFRTMYKKREQHHKDESG